MLTLNIELASRFAHSTLGHVGREYPNGLSLTLTEPMMVSPSELHPIFYGSFDWHSCVHGWWQLFRLARQFPELAPEIMARAALVFTERNVAGEVEYLKAHPGFERPYGWGWCLALHLAAQDFKDILSPISSLISERLKSYLPNLTYPIRSGTHSNTAFALILATEWAAMNDTELFGVIGNWARDRFKHDVAAPWLEPSGEDFLSPTLTEAVLMSQMMMPDEFRTWFRMFMPDIAPNLLEPVTVSDRTDGRIGHLDGLHLSRAWCWKVLARYLPEYADVAHSSAERHLQVALPHLEANYMSEHWLCSFALLALTT